MRNARFRSTSWTATLLLALGSIIGPPACASDGGTEPGETESNVTRADLLTRMNSLVVGYKDAEWDLKRAKYTEAANLVYATYGLSALVAPTLQQGLLVIQEGTSPVLKTDTALGTPHIKVATRHLELAVKNQTYLDNFVSLLTHEYIHVWQSYNGYAGDGAHDRREFLANAFNVRNEESLIAKEIHVQTGFDFATMPHVYVQQRMINAAAVVKTYGPLRDTWGLSPQKKVEYQAEFDAVKAVYDVLARTYNDNGTKK